MKQFDFDFTKSASERKKEQRQARELWLIPIGFALSQIALVIFALFLSPLPQGQTREEFLNNYFQIQQSLDGFSPAMMQNLNAEKDNMPMSTLLKTDKYYLNYSQ